jgi:hypothetical protein
MTPAVPNPWRQVMMTRDSYPRDDGDLPPHVMNILYIFKEKKIIYKN